MYNFLYSIFGFFFENRDSLYDEAWRAPLSRLGASLGRQTTGKPEPRSTEATAECAKRSFTKTASNMCQKLKNNIGESFLHLLGFLGASSGAFRLSFAAFGAAWAAFGPSWAPFGATWVSLWGDLGGDLGAFGATWAVFGVTWVASWGAFGVLGVPFLKLWVALGLSLGPWGFISVPRTGKKVTSRNFTFSCRETTYFGVFLKPQ